MSVELMELKALGVEEEKIQSLPSIKHHISQVSRNAKAIEVANADYALALSAGSPSPTSFRSLQLYLILLVPFMGSLSYGFDASVMSAVNGMEQYLDYFHIDAADAAGGVGTVTALIFGMHTIGSIAGVAIAGPMADRFGRRGGMFVGSVIIMAGAIVGTIAANTRYLLSGRFILGLGITVTTTAAPIYVVEMSPPQWRGRLAGLYNTFYFFGLILCTTITDATSRFNSSASWRVPLAIQIALAGILAIFVFALPESPRWLLSVGRKAEARQILTIYHGNRDENAPLVLLEWKEFEQAVKLDASDKRWWDYSELFNTHNAKNRTVLALLMGFFAQRSGTALGFFLSILFNNTRATIQESKLIIFASLIIATGGALIGTALLDKVGRRTMWLRGVIASTGMLVIVTGFLAKWGVVGGDPQGSKVAIASLLLLGFVGSLTNAPLQVLYPAECLDYNTRAKGMALYALAGNSASLIDTYASPIALKKLQWKYMAISIGLYINQWVLVWLRAVETHGRTLEELDEIFEEPNPVKASLLKRRVVIQEQSSRTVTLNLELARDTIV